ncbi:hypothetical protein ES702_02597 [subsurface metagenome]
MESRWTIASLVRHHTLSENCFNGDRMLPFVSSDSFIDVVRESAKTYEHIGESTLRTDNCASTFCQDPGMVMVVERLEANEVFIDRDRSGLVAVP